MFIFPGHQRPKTRILHAIRASRFSTAFFSPSFYRLTPDGDLAGELYTRRHLSVVSPLVYLLLGDNYQLHPFLGSASTPFSRHLSLQVTKVSNPKSHDKTIPPSLEVSFYYTIGTTTGVGELCLKL